MATNEADHFDRLGRGLSALGAWIDERFPMTKLIKEHATEYYASKNFNVWYGFGVIATVVLVMQLITGIFLTVSTHLMRGVHFVFLSQLHAVTVIFTLLYLPFGKFFHIFQRPAQLGVAFYREAGAQGEAARCARCGAPFASRMHIEDLKQIERELGIQYQPGPSAVEGHYQDVCPACRRKSLALTQDALWRRGA